MAKYIGDLKDADSNILLPDVFTTSYIEPGTDLNTVMTPGIYRAVGSYVNSPWANTAGYMIVIKSEQTGSATGVVQKIFSNYTTFWRVYTSGAWLGWIQQSCQFYKPGDTMAVRGNVGGHTQIVNNQTNLMFSVPLDKPVNTHVSNAKLTASLTLRTPTATQSGLSVTNLVADSLSQAKNLITFSISGGLTIPSGAITMVWIAGGSRIVFS